MNIEQYRALKAQEAEQAQQPVEQPTTPTASTAPVAPPVIEETKPEVDKPEEEEKPTEDKPITVEIDGKELTVDELKNGYLRQSDYTKKTQELANQRKETKEAVELYELLKKNPQAVTQMQSVVQVPETLDPTQSKVIELEQKMYDMMLEREIETLQSKYPDFEVMEVIKMADEKKLTNLEDAYLLVKSQKGGQPNMPELDINKLKEELKKELLKEIEAGQVETSSMITPGSGGIVTPPNIPTLSNAELKVAAGMGMTPEEYAKWRDA